MKLVWDTSSISHALEDYIHSIASAYMHSKRRARDTPKWGDVYKSSVRRHSSEFIARLLLTGCDDEKFECYIPEAIRDELLKDKHFEMIIKALTSLEGKREVEEYYKEVLAEEKKEDITNFSEVVRTNLKVGRPTPSSRSLVTREALRRGLIRELSSQDLEAIALSLDLNAVLVTADRRMRDLARVLGVPTIYTIGEMRLDEIENRIKKVVEKVKFRGYRY